MHVTRRVMREEDRLAEKQEKGVELKPQLLHHHHPLLQPVVTSLVESVLHRALNMLPYQSILNRAFQSKRQILHRRLYIMQRMHQLHHRSQSKVDPSLHCHKDKKTIPLIVKRNTVQCRKPTLHHR